MAIIRSLNDETQLDIWPPNSSGPLTIDPFLRKASLDSIIDLIAFSNGVAMTGSTSMGLTLRLEGNLSYDGSGKLSGLSGMITTESFHDENGPINYEMSGLNLSVDDYLNHATWDSVLSGNDVIYGSAVRDQISAGYGFDTIDGGDGGDSILGGFNGDVIHGGQGNDILRGGNGLDQLFGDSGDDYLYGAKGTDTLTGGSGADRFIFNSPIDGVINIDTITDFEVGIDTISLSPDVFTALGRSQRWTSINDRTADVGVGKLSYDASTGKLAYDADGAGAGQAVVFAVLGVSSHPSSLDSAYFFFGE